MLMLVLLAGTIVRNGVGAQDPPRATVRIVRAAPASAQQWKDTPPGRRREVVRKAADGRIELLRIIEHP